MPAYSVPMSQGSTGVDSPRAAPDENILLQDLLNVVSRLKRVHPLTPSASPNSRAVRRRLKQGVLECIPSEGPWQKLKGEEQEGVDFQALSAQKEKTLQAHRDNRGVDARVARIVEAVGQDAVFPTELKEVLSSLPAGSYATVEDAALSLMCRGYQPTSLAVWRDILMPLAEQVPSPRDVRTQSTRLGRLVSVEARLHERHRILEELTASTHGASFISCLFKHVEALRFASDWNSHIGPGSLRFKRDFKRVAFMQQPHIATQLEGLTAGECDAMLKGELKADLKVWIRKSENVITARNRLLEMYNMFGAGVLIDPVWNVDHLAIHRSSKFPCVYRAVAHHLASIKDHDTGALLLNLHQRGVEVILAVVTVLGNEQDAAYIRSFIEALPPNEITIHE